MLLKISESDLLQSTVLPPSWYRVNIDEIDERLSKDSQSTNWWLKGRVLFNSDTGAKEFEAGVDKEGNKIIKKIENVPTPFPWLFNSKGAFAAVGFLQALGMEVRAGMEVNILAAKGKQVDMFIENEIRDGVMRNVCNGKYRAIREIPQNA